MNQIEILSKEIEQIKAQNNEIRRTLNVISKKIIHDEPYISSKEAMLILNIKSNNSLRAFDRIHSLCDPSVKGHKNYYTEKVYKLKEQLQTNKILHV